MKLSHHSARHACALSTPMAVILLAAGVAAPPAGRSAQHGARPNAPAERIAPNDNRRPAGRLANGVLTLRLEARNGTWYPDGADGLAREVAAFAEEGGPLQNPGPLIRVPAGTEVRVTVRNSLERPLTMFGLGSTRGIAADSFRIEPGEAREMRFTAAEPGTYYYAGKTSPVPVFDRREHDSQLNGVIVVDPPGAGAAARDRVFLISWYLEKDEGVPVGFGPGSVLAINGLSWPHTERFDVMQGDSLHWRWVSVTLPPHPMHLHGFYFRVDAKGDGARDTIYAPEQRRLAVTETLRPGQTMSIVWSPTRPGNWIFHCHFAAHITPASVLRRQGLPAAEHGEHGEPGGDAQPAHRHEMARLVLGIQVQPRGGMAAARRDARPIRLLVRSRPAAPGVQPRYAYVLGGSPAEADPGALPAPGPTLVLEKDRPVAITIVNQSHEPAAVHWHGIELESFPDGVPGWSGSGGNVLQAIPPRDSLTVRFTPPRAGTFMYHSHFNERHQITHGLYGAIVVLEPGQRHDPERDRILLVSDAGPTINLEHGPFARPMLNGRADPAPIELQAGVTYRFRIINIRSDLVVALALLDGQRPALWRHVAKDGADLPASQAVTAPAQLALGVGEIHDVEFTPRSPGELTLELGFSVFLRRDGTPVPRPAPTRVPVHVR